MRRGRICPFPRKKRTENERVKAHVCVDVCVVNEETAVLGAGGQSYAAWLVRCLASVGGPLLSG